MVNRDVIPIEHSTSTPSMTHEGTNNTSKEPYLVMTPRNNRVPITKSTPRSNNHTTLIKNVTPRQVDRAFASFYRTRCTFSPFGSEDAKGVSETLENRETEKCRFKYVFENSSVKIFFIRSLRSCIII
jgi:hypothetical protein